MVDWQHQPHERTEARQHFEALLARVQQAQVDAAIEVRVPVRSTSLTCQALVGACPAMSMFCERYERERAQLDGLPDTLLPSCALEPIELHVLQRRVNAARLSPRRRRTSFVHPNLRGSGVVRTEHICTQLSRTRLPRSIDALGLISFKRAESLFIIREATGAHLCQPDCSQVHLAANRISSHSICGNGHNAQIV